MQTKAGVTRKRLQLAVILAVCAAAGTATPALLKLRADLAAGTQSHAGDFVPIDQRQPLDAQQLVDSPDVTAESEEPPAEASPADSAVGELRHLLQGDASLASGHPERALRHYERERAETDEVTGPLRYRIAVCLHALGRFEAALEQYQEILAATRSPSLDSSVRRAMALLHAQLGQWKSAISLISHHVLHDGTESARNGDDTYLLGELLAHQLMDHLRAGDDSGMLDAGYLLMPKLDAQPDLRLQGLQAIAQEADSAEPRQTALRVVYRFAEDPTGVELQAVSRNRSSLAAVVEQLCEVAEFELSWSQVARKRIRARSTSVDFSRLPLGYVLDCLLVPEGLVWSWREQQVVVQSLDELSEQELSGFYARSAATALNRAVFVYPAHEQTPKGLLLLGNIQAERSALEEAITFYKKAVEEDPEAIIEPEARFNHGQMLRLLERLPEAREEFLAASDTAVGRAEEAAAYLLVALLLLDEGQPGKAVRPVIRALNTSRQSAIRAEAALCGGAAYIGAGDPRSALRLLQEHRSVLYREPWQDRAAFLTALAQRKRASGRVELRNADRTLLSALSHVTPHKFRQQSAALLIADAYALLGFTSAAHDVLTAVAPNMATPFLRNTVRQRVTLLSTDHMTGPSVTVATTNPASDQAVQADFGNQLRLAEMAIAAGKLNEGMAGCRKLLGSNPSQPDAAQALKLLGRAYYANEDYSRAAKCFAGELPTPSVEEVEVSQ